VTVSVELRDIRWAIVAAQHRSLRQAAAALNIRQSTLSRCLRALEQRLGADLFERTNGGTHLTIAGQEFIQAARKIVAETEAIADRLRICARGESGHLTIGVHTALTAGNLRATLIEHRQRASEVEARLVDGSSNSLVSDLFDGTIDIAFVAACNPRRDVRSLPVWSERVVVAVPEGHALSNQAAIYWGDLASECLLLPERGPGPEVLRLIESRLGCGHLFRVVHHDVSLDRLLCLVGAGWGLLPAFEGATGLIHPGVTFREVHDHDGPTRIDFWAYWRESNPNPSLRLFLDILRERYPDLSGDTVVG